MNHLGIFSSQSQHASSRGVHGELPHLLSSGYLAAQVSPTASPDVDIGANWSAFSRDSMVSRLSRKAKHSCSCKPTETSLVPCTLDYHDVAIGLQILRSKIDKMLLCLHFCTIYAQKFCNHAHKKNRCCSRVTTIIDNGYVTRPHNANYSLAQWISCSFHP